MKTLTETTHERYSNLRGGLFGVHTVHIAVDKPVVNRGPYIGLANRT